MLEIIGYITLVVPGVYIVLFIVIIGWDTLGKYNIGAVENTLGSKLLYVIIGIPIIVGIIYGLYYISPFTIAMK